MRSGRQRGSRRGYIRPRASRATRPCVLIACEGARTEPGYFEGLRREWRLETTQVEVCGEECGSDPLSVVNYALKRQRERVKHAKKTDTLSSYDQVWCVIDHDQHPTLVNALDKAGATGLEVALTVPCFELWYLLHYTYTTRPFQDCADVLKTLKDHVPDYQKGKAMVETLLPKLDGALERANKLREHNKAADADNPSTQVDKLVRTLRKMKSP